MFKLLRHIIRFALRRYYSSIHVEGIDNIPKNKNTLLLSNHQNALLDALLISTQIPGKNYFLGRSDVFKRPLIRKFLNYLGMQPVYRVRDGIRSVVKNHPTFDHSATLLAKGKRLALFPEGNHSLVRNVRPLSKGFTRIIDRYFEITPEPLLIVPVGVSYNNPQEIFDEVKLCIGKPIVLDKTTYNSSDCKKDVYQKLQQLTVHIPSEKYERIEKELSDKNVDFTQVQTINEWLKFNQVQIPEKAKLSTKIRVLKQILIPFEYFFEKQIKPQIKENEFIATFRFAYYFLLTTLFFLVSGMYLLTLV